MDKNMGIDLAITLRSNGITTEHIVKELKHRFDYESGCYDSRLAGYTSQELLDVGLNWPSKSNLFSNDGLVELYIFMLQVPFYKVRAVENELKKTGISTCLSRCFEDQLDGLYRKLVPAEKRYEIEREVQRNEYLKAYTENRIPRFSVCKIIRDGKERFFQSYENLEAYNYALVLACTSPQDFRMGFQKFLGLIPITEGEYLRNLALEEDNSHIRDKVVINLDDSTMTFAHCEGQYSYVATLKEAARQAREIFDKAVRQKSSAFFRYFMYKTLEERKKADREVNTAISEPDSKEET